jgi:DNA-binding response OmpR family regulator
LQESNLNSRATILIATVPDHQQHALGRFAELAGHHVIAVGDLTDFDWHMPPDLVVCEHREPQMDGVKLCRYVRSYSEVPLLVVITSVGHTPAVADFLDAGADMCLVSPYDADHFAACLRALLRRSQKAKDAVAVVEVGDFRIVKETQRCVVAGKEVRLSTQEFRLVSYLVQHPYRVLSHEQLLHAIWGEQCTHKAEFLRPVVMSLRKKMEVNWQSPSYIRTEHKGGYFFVPTAIESDAGRDATVSTQLSSR